MIRNLCVLAFGLCLTCGVAPAVAAPENTTADAVIGQPGFTTNLANQGLGASTAATMNGNRGLFVDSTNRLWVADTSNNRVLMFNNAATFANGASADLVLGQADFVSSLDNRGGANPTANTHSGPRSVVVDSAGRCYVADSGNKRILRYAPPFTNGMDAIQVFGQAGAFTTATQAATNAATADNLGNPDGIAIDQQDNLWCADRFLSRVVRYDTPAAAGGNTTADLVIGQLNFTSADANQGGNPAAKTLNRPIGCCLDSAGNLYVADEFNNRLLLFPAPLSTNMNASRVYGQPDFTTSGSNQGGRTQNSIFGAVYVAIDPISGNLYAADSINHRMLEYTSPQTDSSADRVFGQAGDFTTATVNKGGISADSLNDIGGVACDALGNVYGGDRLNNRVLRYNVTPAPPAPPPPPGGNGGGGVVGAACGTCGAGMGMMMPLMVLGMMTIRRRHRGIRYW